MQSNDPSRHARASAMPSSTTVQTPFPLFLISNRYLVFDVNVIMHLRITHRICGVLIGNLPQASQQNIFNGVPLELLPEEARMLVEQGHAFVVDDVQAHRKILTAPEREQQMIFLKEMDARGLEIATKLRREAEVGKAKAKAKAKAKKEAASDNVSSQSSGTAVEDAENSLFDSQQSSITTVTHRCTLPPHPITPTTSYPPLDITRQRVITSLPPVPSSYPLFAHLHSKGYYLSPGLRFGCQYVAYPGDPVRFHSHFLVNSFQWDEPIDMLHLVAGGRLGTVVKKSFLFGGVVEEEGNDKDRKGDESGNAEPEVRTFCLEWAVM